jgi:hypothetical protein
MREMIVEDTLRRVGNGGPFGREGQLQLTRRIPGFAFWGPGITFLEIVKKGQLLWEECSPWTKGLSQLFDSAQAELEFQYSLLTEDARRVESAFVKLSTFEKIAHEYLIEMRQSTASSRNLSESDWLKIMDALDKNGIAVEAELTDSPRHVLEAVRRRGHQITTWRECYQFRSRVFMDDGKNHTLRREVTHAIHKCCKESFLRAGQGLERKGLIGGRRHSFRPNSISTSRQSRRMSVKIVRKYDQRTALPC